MLLGFKTELKLNKVQRVELAKHTGTARHAYNFTVDHCKVKVPVIGWLKTYERLPQGVKPKSITISRTADRWFISFKVEIEPISTPKKVDVVGLEMAVRSTVSACGLSKCRHSQDEAGRNVALRYTSCEQLLPILVSV